MRQPGENRAGLLTAFLAYFIWGFLPIYWKTLIRVPSLEIIMNRILWAFVFAVLILLFTGKRNFLSPLQSRSAFVITLFCSLLIFLNWYIYIWAVNSGKIVECSMGYYINPLVNVFLGMFLLKETLTRYQKIALILACAGVLVMGIQYGRFPWISLSLAFSFGTYGYLKKRSPLESLPGQAAETLLLLPAVAAYFIIQGGKGKLMFMTGGPYISLALVGGGGLTLLTLFLFGYGARKIRLATLGFLQYIAPTLMLLIGVIMYGESFDIWRLLSFSLIWAALILYSITLVRRERRLVHSEDQPAV